MKTATVVKRADTPSHTVDPMNRTIIMSIRKEKQRRRAEQAEKDAVRVASGKFNSIRGLDKLRG